MSCGVKTSLPAGTGVWVVKHVPALTASLAAAKSSFRSSISTLIRSRAQNAEWPSFTWPAVGVEVLAEIPLAIHQADAHERDAQVAGTFQVVPGQDAEATRINRDALVYAELGRKVRHADALGLSPVRVAEPGPAGHVMVQ